MATRLDPVRGREWGSRLHHRRRASPLTCEQAVESLDEMAQGGSAPEAVVAHVEYCLACQAELARCHKLLRLLHQLRTSEVDLPEGIVADVLSSLESAASRSAVRSLLTGRRVAYGGAAVAAGGAATALVMLRRAKRGERQSPFQGGR